MEKSQGRDTSTAESALLAICYTSVVVVTEFVSVRTTSEEGVSSPIVRPCGTERNGTRLFIMVVSSVPG